MSTRCGVAALLVIVSAVPLPAEPPSPWTLHAGAVLGVPVAPGAFRDAWGTGLGLVGGLRRQLTARVALGGEAEFLQFGLHGVSGEDVTGGARRLGRVAVPMHVRLWTHPGLRQTRLDLVVSVGYAHQSVETVSGVSPPRPAHRTDGLAWSGGAAVSRVLHQTTRLALGLRCAGFEAASDPARHLDVWVAAETPLGVRPAGGTRAPSAEAR